jgi:FkbM family methyltransferase
VKLKVFVKKAVKAILPYGILVIYRRIKYRKPNKAYSDRKRFDALYSNKTFKEVYLKCGESGKSLFNFNGVLLPDISEDEEKLGILRYVYGDTFMFPCLLNDNYDKDITKIMDLYMMEGPYGYTDGRFDVTVKKSDIVIDAGAWIGDFSAYAASKDAEVYAFEPTEDTFSWLKQTVELNKPHKIYPIQKGLGDSECSLPIYIIKGNSGGNTLMKRESLPSEIINITTLDSFVSENKIQKIDFIKADIEGSERDMLKGAVNILKTFAPKLAICTYHLPDDPVVLEKIIMDANPKYKVVQLRHKLFACVVE